MKVEVQAARFVSDYVMDEQGLPHPKDMNKAVSGVVLNPRLAFPVPINLRFYFKLQIEKEEKDRAVVIEGELQMQGRSGGFNFSEPLIEEFCMSAKTEDIQYHTYEGMFILDEVQMPHLCTLLMVLAVQSQTVVTVALPLRFGP